MNSKFSILAAALLIVAAGVLARPTTAAPMLSGGTPVPDTSPVPQADVQLLCHVVWEGRPEQPNPLQQVAITLHLQQTKDPGAEADYDVVTDQKGYFSVQIGQLPDGFYHWRVKGKQTLSNSGELLIGPAGPQSVDMGLMRTGDIVEDNVVNGRDFNAFTASFNKTEGDPGFNGNADLTGDNVVNISDFRLLAERFGQRGDD